MNVKTDLAQQSKAPTSKTPEGTPDTPTQPPATPDLQMVYSLLLKGHLRAKTNSAQ
jgi:hypothetical protein